MIKLRTKFKRTALVCRPFNTGTQRGARKRYNAPQLRAYTRTAVICLAIVGLSLTLSIGGQRPHRVGAHAIHKTQSVSALQGSPTIEANPARGSAVTKTINTDGGSIIAIAPDGTRFTLTIPKGAISEPQAITLTPAESIQRLPFAGGLMAAAQITPEDVSLAKLPLLLIEPSKSLPVSEQLSLVAFAFRGQGREFHLYPLEIDPKRISLRLVNFGGYGVARGTEAEQETLRQYPPADPLDRFMMQTQKVNQILRARLLNRPSTDLRRTQPLVGVSVESHHRRAAAAPQTPAGDFNPAAYLSQLLSNLRAQYEEISARLRALKFDCRSNARINAREVIYDARRWQRAVDVNGLLETVEAWGLQDSERERVMRERLTSQGLTGAELESALRQANTSASVTDLTDAERDMIRTERWREQGLSNQEIANLLRDSKAIAEEVQKMYDSLGDQIWQALQRGFNKAYQCCMCEPKDFHLAQMIGYWRDLTLIHETEVFGIVDPVELQQCENAVKGGGPATAGGWRGTVTFRSVYHYKASGEKANSRSYESKDVTYEATLRLDGRKNENGHQIGEFKAEGTQTTERGGRGLGACYGVSRQVQKVTGTTQTETTAFTISLNPRTGNYYISVAWPNVKGNGTYSLVSEKKGQCANPFNPGLRQESPVQNLDIDIYGEIEGEGTIDPEDENVLSGSKSAVIPLPKGEARVTLTWNLSRCKAR